jgi:hypothetical protein
MDGERRIMSDYYILTLVDGTKEILRSATLGGGQFPMTEDNLDYREYLAWVAEGNTAEEWNPNGNQ